jgi:hypothetical protein
LSAGAFSKNRFLQTAEMLTSEIIRKGNSDKLLSQRASSLAQLIL